MIFLILTLFMGGCGVGTGRLDRFEYSRFLMGVQARIVLYAPDEETARGAGAAALDRIAALEAVMSDYRSDSELMQLCEHAGGEPVEVSRDLLLVLQASIELYEESEGAFDVTVGPVVQLWRQAKKDGHLPDDATLAEALSRIGSRLMHLDPKARTVTLTVPGMRLDLGGIGKGYACDEAMGVLIKHGITRALVDIGGDLLAGASPPGKKGWKIRVLTGDVKTDQRGGEVLFIQNAGVATSGDTTQFIEIDGVRYSHIVDPRTGVGLTNRVSVTVIAPSGMLADGLASAISVLGPDHGGWLANRYHGVWVRVIGVGAGDADGSETK